MLEVVLRHALVPRGAHNDRAIAKGTDLRHVVEHKAEWSVIGISASDTGDPSTCPVSGVCDDANEILPRAGRECGWNTINEVTACCSQDVLAHGSRVEPTFDMSGIRRG